LTTQNRNIAIGGNTSVLSQYTDINIKAGSNVTLTYSNNQTTKYLDLTIASSGGGGSVGGTVRSINNISTSQTAGATAGTDYVGQWKDAGPDYTILINRTTNDVLFAISDGGNVRYGTTTSAGVSSTGLQHIVCTWAASSGDMNVYINTVLQTWSWTAQGAVAALKTGATEPLSLGGRTSSGGDMTGGMNNVVFWNRALSLPEIKQIYLDPWGIYMKRDEGWLKSGEIPFNGWQFTWLYWQ